MAAQHQVVPRVVGRDVGRRVAQRAVVLDQALQRLPRQVQTVERGVAALQPRHHAQGLGVVVEAAIRLHPGVQRVLAGVAEGRVAEVVRQRQRFGKVLVQPQLAGDGAGDLRHFQAVGQPRAVEIAHVVDEDLGLVLQLAERRAVDHPVAVALPRAARRRLGFVVQPPARAFRPDGVRGQVHGGRGWHIRPGLTI